MATVKRCDRCGYEAPSGSLKEIFEPLVWQTIGLGFTEVDLCPKCVQALHAWVKDLTNDREKL